MLKIEQIQKLEFLDSIHEQREYNKKLIPEKGDWIEIGKFTPVIEKFDIKERWECIKRKAKEDEITITIKQIDHKRQEKNAKEVIEKILKKHKGMLTATLFKCIIKGVIDDKYDIERVMAKIKHKDNKKGFEKWKLKQDIKEAKEYIAKEKKGLIRLEKELKEAQNG